MFVMYQTQNEQMTKPFDVIVIGNIVEELLLFLLCRDCVTEQLLAV